MSIPEVAARHILKVEGGYSNHREDPGNWTGGKVGVGELKGTKWGIAAHAYPNLDIRNLTTAEALAIYDRDYWTPCGAHLMWRRGDREMALHVFDAAVNHGVSRAKRWATEKPHPGEFLAHRLRFYARLQSFGTFGRGWVNRVAVLLDTVDTARTGALPIDRLEMEDVTIGDFVRLIMRGHTEGRMLTNRRPITQGSGWKMTVRRDA